MYSDTRSNPPEREIEGTSLEDCKAQLYRMFGTGYNITDYKIALKPGLFGLWQKTVVNAKYIVSERYTRSMPDRTMTPSGGMQPYVSPSMPYMAGSQSAPAGTSAGGSNQFLANRDDILKQQSGGNPNALTSIIQTAKLAQKLEEMNKKLDSLSREHTSKEEHDSIVRIDKILEQNEFTPYYINKMNERIRSEFSLEELDDFDTVQNKVIDWIGDNIHIAEHFEPKSPQVIVIVGPTGVGKTSTIAKLAAKIKTTAKNKRQPMPVIHMITTDGIRVAALEQIEHYGDVLEIPVEKAENQEDLTTLYKRYRSSKVDFIFIDTSGCSPNDFNNIAKMKNLLDVPGMHPETYLAVTASTKSRDLEKIIRNYEPFDFKSIIVTKCDETMTYGNVLSVLYEKNKRISLLTTGQEVLHSMERATPYFFLKELDGFNKDEAHIRQKFGPEGESKKNEKKTEEI